MPPPRLMLLAPLLLLLALTPAARASSSCGHTSEDDLLNRLDDRLERCLDAQLHHEALEVVRDRVAANEFDQQRPLALAVFSDSSHTLDALVGAFADALFADARAGGIQVLDLAQMLPDEGRLVSNREVKSALREVLAKTLEACPQRSLVVVENVQLLDDATLPVLDTFLDPLNGERGHLQVPQADGTSKLLDASGAVFLFLFETERADFEAAPVSGSADGSTLRAPTWRDFLMSVWTRKEGLAEEFTPQAFVGRITEGVTLFTNGEEIGVDASRFQECRKHKPQVQSSAKSDSGAAGGNVWALMIIPLALLVAFALLNVASGWGRSIKKETRAQRGKIMRRSSKKRKKSRRKTH